MKKENLAWSISWASVGFVLFAFLALGFFFGGFDAIYGASGPWGLFGYYFGQFGIAFVECADQVLLLLSIFVIALVAYGYVRKCMALMFDWPDAEIHPFAAVKNVAKKMAAVLLEFLPVVMLLVALSLLFGEANMLDKARLMDVSVIGFEHLFTGTYAFAWLGSFHWPHAVIEFVIACFVNVAAIVILPAFYVGYATPRVLREMIVAFSIGMVILAACWLAVPALSPQDRFLDDVYRLPVPADIATAVANYHPQPEIQDFLASVRAGKENLPDLPTSTIPSAHIFWLGIAAYYFFRSKKWLGWIVLPFIIASGLGTVLLAQHYLLDVVASLVVVAVSVWMASLIRD